MKIILEFGEGMEELNICLQQKNANPNASTTKNI